MEIALLIVGLVGVVVGAEWLVRGAAGLALSLGVRPLLVGLTVVSWGTSAPEFTVSVVASLQGSPEIAVGNVIGSNIFNVLFILGLSAVVAPLAVDRQLVRIEVPLVIAASFAVWFLVTDERLGRGEGFGLLSAFVAYLAASVVLATRDPAQEHPPELGARQRKGWFGNALLVAFGLAALVFGSRALVAGAVAVARWMGVSELVIGLTIVAAGTSLPELATSVVASWRGERDIAVGNVIGSNLFNLLAVLGAAAVFAPAGLPVAPSVFHFDLPVMTAAAFACLPIAVTGQRIARWEGLLLFGYGIAYWAYLLLAATHHDRLTGFTLVMVLFAIPLTVVGLALSLVQHLLTVPRKTS